MPGRSVSRRGAGAWVWLRPGTLLRLGARPRVLVALVAAVAILMGLSAAQAAGAPSRLPDLVVEHARNAERGIAFTVRNIGTAPARGGRVAALLFDGVVVREEAVLARLEPGGSYTGFFRAEHPGREVSATMAADWYAEIEEAREDNRRLPCGSSPYRGRP
ncbi:MAG: hypothetical protein KA323_09555 [Planctomycetes bacterium]|mgnify:CR=1 FL=1|nr:hypothetical protein [Planctomycetota bacterium]HQF65335.1 CARDB domain-containing protein [Planctomycetota bacterium]